MEASWSSGERYVEVGREPLGLGEVFGSGERGSAEYEGSEEMG
jgi:hypothetical protein